LQHPASKFLKPIKHIWKVIVWASGLIGAFLAVWQARPLLTAEAGVSLDAKDPYSVFLTVSNESWFPIPKAVVWCQDVLVIFDNGEKFKEVGHMSDQRIAKTDFQPGDKVNVPCPQLAWSYIDPKDGRKRKLLIGDPAPEPVPGMANIAEANILLHVDYTYYLPFKQFHRQFPFTMVRESRTGEFRWLQGLSK
jgi:hypothetical protein